MDISVNRVDTRGARFAAALVQFLGRREIRFLRDQFDAANDEVTIQKFVFVVVSLFRAVLKSNSNLLLPSLHGLTQYESWLLELSEAELVANLCELFEQIDINSDNTLQWDELTGFLVDRGMHTFGNDTAVGGTAAAQQPALPLQSQRRELKFAHAAAQTGIIQRYVPSGCVDHFDHPAVVQLLRYVLLSHHS